MTTPQPVSHLHVNIDAVEGHGPAGSITVADVERAASGGRKVVGTPDRATGMRAAVGAALARSKREIPHVYLSTTIDVSPALMWLTAENERGAGSFLTAIERALQAPNML